MPFSAEEIVFLKEYAEPADEPGEDPILKHKYKNQR
jgi:hypothetical protein